MTKEILPKKFGVIKVHIAQTFIALASFLIRSPHPSNNICTSTTKLPSSLLLAAAAKLVLTFPLLLLAKRQLSRKFCSFPTDKHSRCTPQIKIIVSIQLELPCSNSGDWRALKADHHYHLLSVLQRTRIPLHWERFRRGVRIPVRLFRKSR